MKFICRKCVDDGWQKKPCILKLPKEIKESERDDWERALRWCPFENTISDHKGMRFTGEVPRAEWERK